MRLQGCFCVLQLTEKESIYQSLSPFPNYGGAYRVLMTPITINGLMKCKKNSGLVIGLTPKSFSWLWKRPGFMSEKYPLSCQEIQSQEKSGKYTIGKLE